MPATGDARAGRDGCLLAASMLALRVHGTHKLNGNMKGGPFLPSP
jgi:hypothetical protein